MKTKKLSICAVVVVLGLGLSIYAQAGTSFFGEDRGNGDFNPIITAWPNSDTAHNDFASLLVGTGTETFESYAVGTGTPLPITFAGAGTATLTGGMFVENNAGGGGSGGANYGRFNVSPGGSKYWETTTGFTIDFSAPVAAFGFYATDVGDIAGQLKLTLTDGSTVALTVPNTVNGPGGSVLFYGYVDKDNPWIKAEFGNTAGGSDFFGFDDMTIGSVEQVSAPDGGASIMLMAFALTGMGLLRKKIS